MLHKIIGVIEVWIGLIFFIALLGFVPGLDIVAGFLGSIVGFISGIPFYGFIMALLGTVLFVDGLVKLIKH